MNRRDLLKTATVMAAGLMTAQAASGGKALAAQETPQKAQLDPAPAAAKSALKYQEVMKNAAGDALSRLPGVPGMRWSGLRGRGARHGRSPVRLFIQK